MCDKVKTSYIFIGVFSVSTLGIFIFLFLDNPSNYLTYITVICLNVGNQTQNIALISLLYKVVEKGTRGTIIGLNSMVSSIGIMIISKVGGILFERVSV